VPVVLGNSIHERSATGPGWSKFPICMKSRDDGARGPRGPDRGVTPRYITKKSPRNVGIAAFETTLTILRVFRDIEFFHTGSMNLTRMVKIFKCAERSRSSMMDVEDEHNHMRAAFGLRDRIGQPGTPAAE